MYKIVLLTGMLLFLDGCSYFRFSVAMCDPNDINNLSAECRDYDEKEAEKSVYPKSRKSVTQSREEFDKEIRKERDNNE